MLDSDNQIEVRLVPRKAPEPAKGDNILVIASTAIAVSIPISIAFKLFEINPSINFPNLPELQPPTISIPDNSGRENAGNGDPTHFPDGIGGPSKQLPNPYSPTAQRDRVSITRCHGLYPEGANFRTHPSMTPTVIVGAVPTGDWVILTGETRIQDGITWYEIMNESPLVPSIDNPATYSQTHRQPFQIGWIAGCFIE